MTFQMHNVNPVASIEVDYDGDGTIDDVRSAGDAFTHTYAVAGLFFPTATFVYGDGTRTTAVAAVHAYDPTSFETRLRAKWTTLRDALRRGDIDGALRNVTFRKRQTYRRMFVALTSDLSHIDEILPEISLVQHRGSTSEFQMLRSEEGRMLSHFVLFAFDDDGVWRIKFF